MTISYNNLSLRLKTLHDYCRMETRQELYDLCCDHGNLGLSLVDSFESIILIDQVTEIIDKLKIKVSDIPKADKIFIKNEDCRKLKLNSKKTKVIVMAGIGGLLGTKIVDSLTPSLTAEDLLVVSPHNNLEDFRTFLGTKKFNLIRESLICDNDKFYEVLLLCKGPVKNDLNLTKVERVGTFNDSDPKVKKRYFKKCSEYYSIKNKYCDNDDYSEIISIYENRLQRLDG